MALVGKKLFPFLLTCCFSTVCWGLVPLESLILGDMSATQSRREKDPLSSVFYETRHRSDQGAAQELVALYRGFIDEGENLQQFCSDDRASEFRYANSAQEEVAIRTSVASLQYLGLDLLVRSLPTYARALNWTRDDFEQYSNSLVGNWCSQNLTIISHKELKRNLMAKWDDNHNFLLPSVEGNPYFPAKLMELVSTDQKNAREFYWSTELFKSLCSWSNVTDDFRLLVPLLRDPMVMAYVAREVGGKRLVYNHTSQTIRLEDETQPERVACRGMICRRTNEREFTRLTPQAVGSPSYYADVRRLYCHRLRDTRINYHDVDERIKNILNTRTLEENLIMSGQFKALLTGIPNFFIWSNSYDQGQAIIRTSFDQAWDRWANGAIAKLAGELTYEEPLTVELIERDLFYNIYRKDFAVHFDINQGEFDRINRIAGKITATFDLNISHKMLHWLRRSWRGLDPTQTLERQDIVTRFKNYIKKDVQSARAKLVIPPWRGDIEEIIAVELLEQFSKYDGPWDYPKEGFAAVPVHLHYGAFALRFMHYRHQVQKRLQELSRSEDKRPNIKTP